MYKDKDLSNLFGKPDEAFKAKFDDTLASLRAQESTGPERRRMSMGAITAIIVLCALLLTGAAYAVSYIYFQFIRQVDDVDMGPWILVSMPDEEYQSEYGWRYGYPYWFYAPERQPVIRAQTVEIIREQLRTKVFTYDGQPFDLFVPIPDSNDYFASSRGNALFNELGEEIAEIYFSYSWWVRDYRPSVSIMTVAEYEAMHAPRTDGVETFDYSEAVEISGMVFRLPGIYTEYFGQPEFRIRRLLPPGIIINPYTGEDLVTEVFPPEVRVLYTGEPSGIGFLITPVPDENVDTFTLQWFMVDSIIEEGLVADTVVYRIINDELMRYTWEHEGLVYMLFNFFDRPNQFTDEQFIEIIWSMIE